MQFNKTLIAAGVMACALTAAPLQAAVPASEIAKLGDSLTPIGAERAGNGNEIPAWTGGLREVPASYPGNHFYTNPFPDEQPLFRIDRSNVDEHKHRLSPGQVAMIQRYDSYFIPVYPTHRTAVYPQNIMDRTKQNATTVTLEPSGNGLVNYEIGVPFPIPQSGVEVIFNHLTRYRGGAIARNVAQVTPQPNGNFSPVKFTEEIVTPTFLEDYKPEDHENVLFYFKQTTTSPSRLAGNVLLVHETIDQVAEARRAWIFNSGQRRVRRAPQVAYDGPGTAADGQRTSDNLDLYNGAPDRYNWELIGKKEMYIPYNAYDLADRKLKYSDIIKAGHINQELTRYELHRVWHVRATLKDGERHIYAQRDFYVDEDTWQIAIVDHYDGRGELWRVAEAHMIQSYDLDIPAYAFETLYDLLSGRYLVMGLTNEEDTPYTFGITRRSQDFTPAALRRAGVR
ncbi:MAG: DUF1329 domain-containing protein [Marinobacter sp.]|nr:DUF1329 domain-containing protein [Marinobacter sp.]